MHRFLRPYLVFACLAAISPVALAADINFPVGNGQQKKWKDMGDGTIAEVIAAPTPGSFTTGQLKIATLGTAVCVSFAGAVNGGIVRAYTGNVGDISIGSSSSVNNIRDGTGNGDVLSPGEKWAIASNTTTLCINGAAGNWVSFTFN